MRQKGISLVMAFLLVLVFSGVSYADTGASFLLVTGKTEVGTGSTFDVNVNGTNTNDLYSYEVVLIYDRDKLEFVKAVSGIQNGFSINPVQKDNKVTIAFTKTGEAEGISGNATLCTVTFKGIKAGQAGIRLESVRTINSGLSRENTYTGNTVNVAVNEGGTQPSSSTPTSPSGSTPGPSTTNDGKTTTVLVPVTATADPVTGSSVARIGAGAAAAMAGKAIEAEASGQKALVEIKVEGAGDSKSVDVEIPRDAFRKIADETDADIKVDAGIGTITFDAKAVASISGAAAAGDISIQISKVDKTALSVEIQEIVGDRPVYDFSVKAGGIGISDFGNGKAEISIPYTSKPGEKKNAVVVYYIDSAGKLQTIRGKYDAGSRTVKFSVKHFSRYAVGYNEVSFSDVAAGAWYNEAVGFMSARGIVNGVGGGRLAPGDTMKRADFLVMVMNAYGIGLDANITDNFSDAGSKYYTGYLGTAKRLGLVSGVGGGRFFPESTISRQDMFVILFRVLEKLDELPTGSGGKRLESFDDAGEISAYAREAMKLFAETGVISGDGRNLAPGDTSTRVQAVQVLYNLLSK